MLGKTRLYVNFKDSWRNCKRTWDHEGIALLTIPSFLGVDAYWAFCMAVNIYLVFFRGYNTKQLRGLDRKYFIACYGISLIPAITYLFINTKERGKIYGGAVVSTLTSTPGDCIG